jgi:lipoprotein-releasing system permease protein
MLNNASLFLGLRYLQPKRSFLSIITIISVLGIMLGVGVLIVVIPVMKGFELDFKKLLIGFEPHVLLMQDEPIMGEGAPPASKWQQVLPEVRKLPGVISAAPFAAGMVMVSTEKSSTGIEIYGLPDTGAEVMKEKLSKQFTEALEGEPKASMELGGDEVVINDTVANQLGVGIGDEVTLVATSNVPKFISSLNKAKAAQTDADKAKVFDELQEGAVPRPLTIAGILRADTTWGRCYVPLHVAQELFGLKGRVQGIGIELADAHSARDFAKALMQGHKLPEDWGTNTWMDRHSQRLAAIQNERVMMWFVLSFVILVAAFSVATTTLTVTVQKRREIGILTALGARVAQIVGVFMTQATVVALIGTVMGYLGGMTVLHYRNDIRDGLANQFDIQIFDKKVYFLAEIPANLQTSDVLMVCSLSFVLCLLAAFLPAFFAARVDPAVALRD